jgi:hypothetical protein
VRFHFERYAEHLAFRGCFVEAFAEREPAEHSPLGAALVE